MSPVNTNIEDPELIRADNEPIGATGRTLVWSDEFNAEKLDPEKWFFESGDGSQYGLNGWGNDELQWYLPDNALLLDGKLVITARSEVNNGYQYTSGRIITRDRFAFRYGRVEARMRLPGGQGLWPAFWLFPQDATYGGWAASGEIDIVEAVNLGAAGGNDVHGTIHYGGEWPNNTYTGNRYTVPSNAVEQFHTYAIEWDATEIRWYVDDVLYAMQNNWTSTGGVFPAPFDQQFYLLLNVAVGGNFPGAPDATTQFPVSLEVDYVRVYSGNP
ncbi:MAG: glycoside hydrolase family 16 protein [Woeseiaceae bacterium]